MNDLNSSVKSWFYVAFTIFVFAIGVGFIYSATKPIKSINNNVVQIKPDEKQINNNANTQPEEVKKDIIVEQPKNNVIEQKPVKTYDVEKSMVTIVNNYRTSNNLSVLNFSDKLSESAKKFAEYLSTVSEVSHYGPNKTNSYDRARDENYEGKKTGQIISVGFSNFEKAFKSIKKKKINKNLLGDNSFTDIGIAVVDAPSSKYKKYYVIVLGQGVNGK